MREDYEGIEVVLPTKIVRNSGRPDLDPTKHTPEKMLLVERYKHYWTVQERSGQKKTILVAFATEQEAEGCVRKLLERRGAQ